MALPPINIVIKATTDGFRRGVAVVDGQLDKLEGSANSVNRRIGTMGSRMTLVAGRLGIVAAVAATAAGAMLAFAGNAAAMGDAIGDGAKAAGLSTTAFQEYRFALKEAADMTDDDFASAMEKLNKSLGEAREGSKGAIAAFERIGISQADIASGSVDTEAALAAFIKKMEETTDPATAAAMAADLFGKSGASIGAALSGVPGQVGALVARARELGVVMGPDAVKAAGEFDAKMKELGTQFGATQMKLADKLLPVLVNDFLPFLTNDLVPGINKAIETTANWVAAIGRVTAPLEAMKTEFAAKFGEMGPTIEALFDGPAAPITMAVAAIGTLEKAWPGVSTAASSAITSITGFIDGAIAKLGEWLTKIGEVATALGNLFTTSQGGFNDGLQVPNGDPRIELNGMLGTSGRLPSGGSNSRGGLPNGSSGSSTGASLIDGMVDGMNLRMQERLPEIQAAAQLVTDTFKAQLGVQSPSTVFQAIGEFIGQGLANGIASTQGIVASAVSTMGAGAVAANDAMVNDILGGLNTLFGESKQVGAGLALVSTMIGAAKELQKGTFGFASAARVIAQGMAFVKAIKGAKKGGEGGGGMRGGGGGAAAAQQPTTTMQFTFQNDPFGFGESFARQMVAQLNKAQQSGSRIIGVIG